MRQDEVNRPGMLPVTSPDVAPTNQESSGFVDWTSQVIKDTWGISNGLVCPHTTLDGHNYRTNVPRAVIGLGESALLAPITNLMGMSEWGSPKEGLENVISASTVFVHGLYDIAGGPDCTKARIVL